MKKFVLVLLLVVATVTCLLSSEHDDIVQIFKKIYPGECKSDYDELFHFWADFIVYLNQLDESEEITEKYVNYFLDKYSDVDRLMFLEWSINQKYPYETQKIRSWSDFDIAYPLKYDYGKRIPTFTDLFIENSEDMLLKSHLLMPLNVIATVAEVNEEVTTTTYNRVFKKTPVKLNILKTLGDQFEQSTIIGYVNALKLPGVKEIRYNYYPSTGDLVFAKIWITQTNQKNESGDELLIDTILEIHQIVNGLIIKNETNFKSREIAGLQEKTSVEEYKTYWLNMFNKIIGGSK